MTLVATGTVRQELSVRNAMSCVRRLMADGTATGVRGPLHGLEGRIGIVATSGAFRLGDRQFAGARLYHTTTPTEPDDSELTFLYDDASGELLVLAIGCDLGEMRNGALGALAAARCVGAPRPVVAVVGIGRQAFAQCEYLWAAFEVSELRVVGRDADRVSAFVDRLGLRCVTAHAWPSVQEAVTGADVVVTATSSETPVLEAEWLRPGVHLAHVGTKKHGHSELPAEAVERADVVVVDSLEQFLVDHDAGRFTYPYSAAAVRGLADVLRSSDDLGPLTTLYISNGLPGGEIAVLATWFLCAEGNL